MRSLRWLGTVVGLVCSLYTERANCEVPNETARSSWRWALHGGWWDAGFDLTSPQGISLGIGVPWVLYLPVLDYSGKAGQVAVDASAGYRYPLSTRTSLSGKVLTVYSYDWGDPCDDGCTEHTHRLYILPVLGIRHRLGTSNGGNTWGSGPIFGVDLALAIWSFHHSDGEASSGWHRKNIPPWAGPAFSQLYGGYEW